MTRQGLIVEELSNVKGVWLYYRVTAAFEDK